MNEKTPDAVLQILLVEDNPTDVLLLEEALEQVRGVKIMLTHVKRLDEALARLQADYFDAVLLDLGLPDSAGLETFTRTQSHYPHVPILVLSGLDDEILAFKAVQDGAQDYLVKGTLDSIMLARTIRYAIERKRSEQKLMASEVSYRRLFETAQDGIFLLDAITGQITDANPFLESLLGYKREEVIGKRLWEIGSFRNKTANMAAFRTLQEKSFFRYEDLPLLTKDGQEIHAEFVSNVYGVGEKQVIQCNIRDITARRQAEAAVEELQHFLQSTIDALSAHIAVLDESGKIIAVNQAWRQFAEENKGTAVACGIEANYLEVCERASGIWAGEAPEVAAGIRKVLASHQSDFCLEYPCHSPSEERWFNVCVTRFKGDGPVRVAVSHENITARKLIETTLGQSEARFRTAITETPLPMIIHREDGKVLQISKGWTEYSGYTIDDIPTIHDWAARAYGSSSEHAQEYIDELYRITETRSEGEWTITAKNGEQRVWEFRSTPLGTFGDSRQVVLSAALDITESKRAEHAQAQLTLELQQQRQRLDDILTHMPGIVWEADIRQGGAQRLDYTSKYIETMLGYSVEEWLANPNFWLSIVHPDDQKSASERAAREIAAGRGGRSQYRMIAKDGRTVWVETRTGIIHDEEGEAIGIRGVTMDISERILAEDHLRQSEANLARAQRIAHLGSWELDLSNLHDLNTNPLRWSDEVFRVFGHEPGAIEVSNDNFFRAVHPDDRARIKAAVAEAIQSNGNYSVDHRIIWPDGTERLIHEQSEIVVDETSGKPLKMVGTLQDITSRKRAEEALRWGEIRYRSLIKATTAIVWSTPASGEFETPQLEWSAFTGHDWETHQGWGWLKAVHPDDQSETARVWAAAVENSAEYVVEHRLLRRDGEYRDMAVRAVPLIGEDGAIREWIGIHTDITERKQAQAALQEREVFQQTLFENFPNGSVNVFDRDLRYVLAAGRGLEQSGMTPAQLVGKTLDEIFTSEQVALAKPHYLKALSGQTVEFELPLFERWYNINVAPLYDPKGEVLNIIAVAQDITERKQAEEERDRFFTMSLDLLCIADHNGLFKRLNPAFEATLGFTNDELMAKPFLEWVHPDDREATLAVMKDLDAGAPTLEFMNRYRCRDGSYRWLSWVSAPFEGLIYAAAHDVTSLKNAQAALHEANNDLEMRVSERTVQLQDELAERRRAEEISRAAQDMLQLVMNHIPQAIFWKDRDCVYMGCNNRLAQDAGYDSQLAVIGKTCHQMPWAERAAADQADDRRVMESDTPQLNIEEPRVKADGSTAWLRTNKIPLHDADGQVMGVLGSYEDITLQREAEAAVHQAREEAERANEAKSEFLSRMSHELRTPLNAILGFGQLLEMRDLKPREADCATHIVKAGRHLLGLINEVLDIARVEAGHVSLSLEPLCVAEILRETMEMVAPLGAARGIRFDTDVACASDTYVLADRQRLKQIFINVLSNAVKYNREGGFVIVSCEPESEERVRIEIKDSGHGITPDDLQKLFTPFERLGAEKLQIEGTGLGLVLSRRLAEAMGGTLEARSVVGQGSTFSVVLPAGSVNLAMHQDAARSVALPTETGDAIVQNKTVLAIEDNPANLYLLEIVFESRPHVRLIGAGQGGIGLELAREHRPDLILLDLHLPDIQGAEVLRRLQEHPETREIPVVVVSADATPSQVARLLQMGARQYITKPFNVAELLQILDEM